MVLINESNCVKSLKSVETNAGKRPVKTNISRISSKTSCIDTVYLIGYHANSSNESAYNKEES